MTTQVVDRNDDILGFVHTWIERMARHVGIVRVVCLREGEHSLPENVRVYSLGKERGISKGMQLFRLYRFAFQFLPKSDVLFVHMNHRYVLLLWLLARLFRVPIVLWKTHRGASMSLRAAYRLSSLVTTASPVSLDLSARKQRVVGQGIDTDFFSFAPPAIGATRTILSVGRISPIKEQHRLVDVLDILTRVLHMRDVRLIIVGPVIGERDRTYAQEIRRRAREKNVAPLIEWRGSIPHRLLLALYREADLVVDFCTGGGLDKVPMEAMAMGRLVVSSQPGVQQVLGAYRSMLSVDPRDLAATAAAVHRLLSLSREERERVGKELRVLVVRDHNVDRLVEKLVDIFKEARERRRAVRV